MRIAIIHVFLPLSILPWGSWFLWGPLETWGVLFYSSSHPFAPHCDSQMILFPSLDKIPVLFCFVFEDFIYLWETQREGSMQEAWCGTRSQDSSITPWVEGRFATFDPPRRPWDCGNLRAQKVLRNSKYLLNVTLFLFICSCVWILDFHFVNVRLEVGF